MSRQSPEPERRVTPSGELSTFLPGERHRYARHFVLSEVGVEGQARLRSARILVVGAGGLGSPVALYLAAAGVGTLGLVDFDAVDLSNLQRQILHGTGDVGRAKLDSARDRLAEINPHVEVVPHPVRLTSENALEILADYDVVVDGSDNFPTRYLVNDACVLLGKPNVYGSILRWEGQLSLFTGGKGGGCYRCLFREPPPPGMVPNCAEGGVMGVMAGVVGSLQALEAMKVVLGAGDTMAGRLLLFDGLDLSFREIRLRPNPGCPVCGEEPTQTTLIDYERFCGVAPDADGEVEELEAAAVARLLAGEDPPLLLDVREAWEWQSENLGGQGAVHIPRGELPERIGELPRDRALVVMCRSGGRSRLAAASLASRGFRRVSNLQGGLEAWIAAGLPVPSGTES